MTALLVAIDRGDYTAGTRLPSERDLVLKYRASRDTIRRAMQELEAEGVVEKRGTAGTFVTIAMRGNGDTAPARQLLRDAGRKRRAELAAIERVGIVVHTTAPGVPDDWVRGLIIEVEEPVVFMAAPPQVSEALKLAPGELVIRLRRILTNEEWESIRIVETYYPGRPLMEQFRIDEHTYMTLDVALVEAWRNRMYAKRIRRVIDDVEVRALRAAERREYGMLQVDAVVSVERTVLDRDENVLEVTYIVSPASRVKLRHVYEIVGGDEGHGEHEAASDANATEE
ncbi:MAG TPA: GntR family transcriptional regulator [Ktedonobacterales bacterium]|nr:GntR family transcriptional regulator [Ktedonobacterales bacterium]